jgi:hypothetical protein
MRGGGYSRLSDIVMKFITTLLLSFCTLNVSAQPEAKSLLEDITRSVSSHRSISYDVYHLFKIAGRRDTLHFLQRFHILRDEEDKLWGGKFWFGQFELANEFTFYNRGEIFMVNKDRGTYSILIPDSPGDRLPQITHSLLRTELLRQQLSSHPPALSAHFLRDTVIAGQSCYQLDLDITNHGGDKSRQIICARKNDLFPVFKREYVPIDEGVQYSEWLYSNVSFDQVNEERFSRTQIPSEYQLK